MDSNLHEGKLSKYIAWHSTVTQCVPKLQKEMSRIQHVVIYRLGLGYRCSWEIAGHQQMECPSCSRSTYQPLLHYTLVCEMAHNHFGLSMDVKDPGAPKEAASRVKLP